jgi:hypothetical protein
MTSVAQALSATKTAQRQGELVDPFPAAWRNSDCFVGDAMANRNFDLTNRQLHIFGIESFRWARSSAVSGSAVSRPVLHRLR